MKRNNRVVSLFVSMCVFLAYLLSNGLLINVMALDQIDADTTVTIMPEIIRSIPALANSFQQRLADQEPSLNTIVYQNTDGNYQMVYFPMDVKYTDSTGSVRDISNTLVQSTKANRNAFPYTNEANNMMLAFSDDVSVDGVTFEYYGITVATVLQNNCVKRSTLVEDNTIAYHFDEYSVVYSSNYDNLEGAILVRNNMSVSSFTLQLDIGNSSLRKIGKEYLIESESDEEHAVRLDQVRAYDANGNIVPVLVEMNEGELTGQYWLTISLDITTSDISYPVVIQPTLYAVDYGNDYINDAVVYSGYPTVNYGAASSFTAGYRGADIGVGRTLIKFPQLYSDLYSGLGLTSSDILDVDLSLYSTSPSNYSRYVGAYQHGMPWLEGTITYELSAMSNSNGIPSNYSLVPSTAGRMTIDITGIVQNWMQFIGSMNSQGGIVLRNQNETSTSYNTSFISKDSTTVANRPYVTVIYTTVQSEIYRIKNVASNTYMSVMEVLDSEGEPLDSPQKGLDKNGGSILLGDLENVSDLQSYSYSQEFHLKYDGSQAGWRIYPLCSQYGRHRVVDVIETGSGTAGLASGAEVQLYSPDSGVSQWFQFIHVGNGQYKIVLKYNANLALTGDAATANICVSTYTGASSQKWILERSDRNEESAYYGSLGLLYPFRDAEPPRIITSSYGFRIHPTSGKYSAHSGIDIGGSNGKALYSIFEGVVIRASTTEHSSMGYYIIVEATNPDYHAYGSDQKLRFVYMHMQAPSGYSAGQTVTPSSILGYVGATGDVTGPHLHFGIIIDGGTATTYSHTTSPMAFYPDIHFTY